MGVRAPLAQEPQAAVICSAHDDCPLRPPVDVPAAQAVQALREVALEPPKEYVLLGQGFVVPDDWPARQ